MPGYWATGYFATGYWHDDYWAGTGVGPTSFVYMTASHVWSPL
jgi:hypothetical protein